MMNRKELKEMLEQKNIPSYLYNLDGKGITDERFVLNSINNQWQVYFCERGVKTTDMMFDTESEACYYIHEQLVN